MKKDLGIGGLLLAICVVAALKNHAFLGQTNLQNLARLIGLYGIFSIGLGLIIITGGIDLSVGSVFALQGVLLVMMLREWQWAWPLAILASFAGTMFIGLLHGLLITRAKLQPFIVTLCGLLIYRGLARFIANDDSKGFGFNGFQMLRNLAKGTLGPIPMPFILFLIIGAIMWVVVHRSVYGRYLFAVGKNEEAARYSGINTRRVIVSAYIISGLLTGISGVLIAFDINSISPADHGTFYELYGIAAAVLGGCSLQGGEGSVIGIMLGTALLPVLENLVELWGIPSSLDFVVKGTVILAGVLLDQLLLQRKKRQKIPTGLPNPESPPPKSAPKV